jgi:DnaK suppressor protein
MSFNLSREFVEKCRSLLVSKKAEILNRMRLERASFTEFERGGDEIDLTVANQAEHQFLVSQDRLRENLLEIEMALSRIEQGSFGFCEETEEMIEPERLLSIPWTRVSIEGAEIREAIAKKFAR